MDNVAVNLKRLKEQGRYRQLIKAQGIDLSSNDYLNLGAHPDLRAFALESLERGVALGAGGSRLLRGNAPEHEALEFYAASYFSAKKSLFFANGFAANYALLSTLPSRHDTILYDSLVHASMREGIRASNARAVRVAHNDVGAFEEALQKLAHKTKTGGQVFIAVESLYSMDGDFAPLAALYELTRKYEATLIVDEAHATGVWGAHGKGLCESLIKAHGHDHLITVHTCGKGLGVAGGLICASSDIVDYLINEARPFIFSTAPPPFQAALVQKSLELSAGEVGEDRRQILHSLCDEARLILGGQGLNLGSWEDQETPSQIIPIILSCDERAVHIAKHLQGLGYDIRAIRPPSVPEGSARLRLSLNAGLDKETLCNFANHLISCMETLKN